MKASKPPKDHNAYMRGLEESWRVTVKSLRERRGITRTRMAEDMGITQSHVSAVENGNRRATISYVIRAHRALNALFTMTV